MLTPLEFLYKGVWRLWDTGYRVGLFPTRKVLSKVISVGNLTWGGSGKTPTVEYLARGMEKRGNKIALLSRGYGSPQDRQKADEVQWLIRRLGDIPVFANPDRISSARKAEELGCQFLILDDGFQHRRLGRQLDLVTIDATDPFGNGHLIPTGKLREPVQSLKRADWIILTKTDLVNDGELSRIKEKIQKIVPDIPISETIYRPVGFAVIDSQRDGDCPQKAGTVPISGLKDQNIGLVAAIGNPEAFKRTVEKLGARVTQTYFKRDHANYSAADFQEMEQIQKKNSIFCWVTTSKDAVKMRQVKIRDGSYFFNGSVSEKIRTVPIYELEIELVFKEGERELWQAIESL